MVIAGRGGEAERLIRVIKLDLVLPEPRHPKNHIMFTKRGNEQGNLFLVVGVGKCERDYLSNSSFDDPGTVEREQVDRTGQAGSFQAMLLRKDHIYKAFSGSSSIEHPKRLDRDVVLVQSERNNDAVLPVRAWLNVDSVNKDVIAA